MREKKYRYRKRCETCKNFFNSDKANKMFCCEICARKYFGKKYPTKDEKN